MIKFELSSQQFLTAGLTMQPFSKSSSSKPLRKKPSTVHRPHAINSFPTRNARTCSSKASHLPSAPSCKAPSLSSSSHRSTFRPSIKDYRTPSHKITPGDLSETNSTCSSNFRTATSKQRQKKRNIVNSTCSSSCPTNRPGSGSSSPLSTDVQILQEDIARANKKKEESAEGKHKKATTPPAQASVSPEIACSSSVISAVTDPATNSVTPYGAGHLVSGITDKRKCRPTGLLVFEDDKYVDTDNNGLEFPSPIRASMHWLEYPSSNAREESPKSLHSENMMQTPDSDSNMHKNSRTPWHGCCSVMQDRNIPEAPEVLEHGSSYQFDVSTESSLCAEHFRFKKEFEDLSNSCGEWDPQSPKKIIWVDGMDCKERGDDFECCRCFSDAEEEHFQKPIQTGLEFASAFNIEGDISHTRNNAKAVSEFCCAESISTDGGGVTQSKESDWLLHDTAFFF